MLRLPVCVLTLLFCSLVALAQDRIHQGKIKKIDADRGTLVVASEGKDIELAVAPSTRFMGADGKELAGLKDAQFKEGANVMFKSVEKDGKNLLVGLRLAGAGAGGKQGPPKIDLTKFKPLTEMGDEFYQGHKGGLYPDGKNERPAAHEKAGLELAKKVQPLDPDGKPSPRGKIVLLTVGMSNTTQVSSVFKKIASADPARNPDLVIVDGAQGGMTAARIQDPTNPKGGAQYWRTVDERLAAAGTSRAQVQAIWIKEADAGPSSGFPAYARTLQAELARIVQLFPERFPNARLVYLSGRTFGGFAKTTLNPEPYAFESALSVRWLIEDQLKGDAALNYDPARGKVTAPWLSWGPYLWANGMTKRADGFHYAESDFAGDGTHPSPAGQRKVAELLLTFFKNDSTTKGWFTK